MTDTQSQIVENEISTQVVTASVEVHRELGGPGLLEHVYEEALVTELRARGLHIARQVVVPVVYKGIRLDCPLRLDLIVERAVIVECKAIAAYHALFECQMLTYLRQTRLRLGLVINFGARLVRDGIHRVVNGLPTGS